MWGQDYLHIISFPMSPFEADLPNLSEIASLQAITDSWALTQKIQSQYRPWNMILICTLLYLEEWWQSGQAASRVHSSLSGSNITHVDKAPLKTPRLAMACIGESSSNFTCFHLQQLTQTSIKKNKHIQGAIPWGYIE